MKCFHPLPCVLEQVGDYVKVEADRGEDLGMVVHIFPMPEAGRPLPATAGQKRGFGQFEKEHIIRAASDEEVRSTGHSLGARRTCWVLVAAHSPSYPVSCVPMGVFLESSVGCDCWVSLLRASYQVLVYSFYLLCACGNWACGLVTPCHEGLMMTWNSRSYFPDSVEKERHGPQASELVERFREFA